MADDASDTELITRCRAGEPAAWTTLVQRYRRLVYTVPRRAGLPDELAADVFQTTFTRLVEHIDRLADPARVQAWLVTTAKRESLRLVEQARRKVDLAPAGRDDEHDTDPLEAIPDPAPLPETQLADLQELDRLRRAVDRLDDRSRRFVELLFLQDEPLPYSEIAARLGIAEGSIGPTRARCLDKIRLLMGEA